MHKILLAAMLAVAPATFAQSPNPSDAPAQADQMQQRIARRAARLGQALGLDAAGVQRVQGELENFATQRRALGQQLRQVVKTLRAAAQGDAAAQGQVDAAIAQARSLRAQQMQLKDQLFDSLSNGLAPQQKAKLAMMLVRGHKFGHRGFGRWQRRQMQAAPQAQP